MDRANETADHGEWELSAAGWVHQLETWPDHTNTLLLLSIPAGTFAASAARMPGDGGGLPHGLAADVAVLRQRTAFDSWPADDDLFDIGTLTITSYDPGTGEATLSSGPDCPLLRVRDIPVAWAEAMDDGVLLCGIGFDLPQQDDQGLPTFVDALEQGRAVIAQLAAM